MTTPFAMTDPLNDHTPTSQRIEATVPLHHELNLTLPPRSYGPMTDEAFAVVKITMGTRGTLARIMGADKNNFRLYSTRFWSNDPVAPVTDLAPAGLYLSIRGARFHITNLLNVVGLIPNIIHASENFEVPNVH
jgi:hypothetical protein